MNLKMSNVKKGKLDVETKLQESASQTFGKAFGPEMWAKLTLDPRTKPFMSQPDFVEKLKLIQQNPQLISSFLNDQRMMTALGVLLNINLSAAGPGADPMQTDFTNPTEDMPKETPKEEPKAESKKESPKTPEKVNTELTPQQKAENEKELGNTAYKNKQFDEALKYYTSAKNLDPDNMIYLLNIAAVKLELGQYDECIADCNTAIEVGRAHRASFQNLAKAYARIASAYAKQDKLGEAIKAYNQSLTEHRTPETLKKLQEVEKIKKDRDVKDYIDPQKAKEEKEKGNEYFKNADYPNAIKCYTEAMKRDPTDFVLYSNRAACYTKLAEYTLGMSDCDKCLEMNPNFAKAYSPKAYLFYIKKDYVKAIEYYEKGLKLDPDNKELKDGYASTMQAFSQQQSAAPDEEAVKRAVAQDPELQQILSDPVMQQILQDMKNDPRAAAEHLKKIL